MLRPYDIVRMTKAFVQSDGHVCGPYPRGIVNWVDREQLIAEVSWDSGPFGIFPTDHLKLIARPFVDQLEEESAWGAQR